MTILLLILGLVLGIALSAISSGAETGIYTVNPVRVTVAAESNVPGAKRLERLIRRRDDLVTAALVGTNVADYIITVCLTLLLLQLAVPANRAELYATAILTPTILVFGGVLPKDFFRRNAESLMYRAVVPLQFVVALLGATGVLGLLRLVTRWLSRLIGGVTVRETGSVLTRARTEQLLREGVASGGLSEYQRDLIDRIMRISRTSVQDVMVPLERMLSIPVDLPRDDLLRIARMAHFSRIPVYEKHPARVIGTIDVMDVLMHEGSSSVAAYVKPVERLRTDSTVTAALLKMQKRRQKIALVERSRGRCVGLLTIKDLVEEIVGDLEAW
ncbi:MAG: CNNM domain-containing protein [Phycisphaerae bacterium]